MQAVTTGTLDLETISDVISAECSLHSVGVQAVLIALGKKLDFYLHKVIL
jgi:hypothetical protein